MVAFESQAALLKTLSHPTRLAVLDILRGGEQCVCHMEAVLGLRQASLSQQLMILRQEGLVRVRRDGLNVFYRAARPEIFTVLDALPRSGRKPPSAGRSAACPCPKCSTRPRAARRNGRRAA